MIRYSFLTEASLAKKLAIGVAGTGALGALAGNIVSRTNYQAPDDNMLIQNHEAAKVPIADRIKSVESEIKQLMAFRNRLEQGDPDIDVPIQTINEKLYAKQIQLRNLKKSLSKLTYMTTQDLRDAHKKSHIRKATLTGGAAGAALGSGIGALV